MGTPSPPWTLPMFCKRLQVVHQSTLQEAVPLGRGTFGKRLRNVWQQFTCTAVTVPVREAEHCLSAIPVTHPSQGFMNFQTQVLQSIARAESCLEHFPVRLRTTTGWIRLLPSVVAKPATRPAQHTVPLPHHHADRPTGLYTEHELQEWQHLQSVPAFRRIATADLAQGRCHEWGNCPLTQIPGGDHYSFSGLEQKLVQPVWPSWLTVIGQVLQDLTHVAPAAATAATTAIHYSHLPGNTGWRCTCRTKSCRTPPSGMSLISGLCKRTIRVGGFEALSFTTLYKQS